MPPQFSSCLARIAAKLVKLGSAKIPGVDANQFFACCSVSADFFPACSVPLNPASDLGKSSSMNSRTEWLSPVAKTKSSGCGRCSISHMPLTKSPLDAMDDVALAEQ